MMKTMEEHAGFLMSFVQRDGHGVLGSDIETALESIDYLSAVPGALDAAAPEDGRSLLMWAVMNNHHQVGRALLNAGADCGACDTDGNTALMHAARLDNGFGIFHDLVKTQKHLDAQNQAGETALIICTRNERYYWAVLLACANADVTLRDRNGRNAEDYMRPMPKNLFPDDEDAYDSCLNTLIETRHKQEALRRHCDDGLPALRPVAAVRAPQFKLKPK